MLTILKDLPIIDLKRYDASGSNPQMIQKQLATRVPSGQELVLVHTSGETAYFATRNTSTEDLSSPLLIQVSCVKASIKLEIIALKEV